MNHKIQIDPQPENPLSELYLYYLNSLLSGNRQEASKCIIDAADNGVSTQELYLNVFQASQYEIGRLWQINEITVAQEHYCTAATQMIMSQLYPRIFQSKKNGHRMIATCVGGELHEIGIRMVADFFEMEGWDTYYLGASTPTESVLKTIQSTKPDIVAVSVTMPFNITEITKLISDIHGLDTSLKVIVGGGPFNIAQDMWKSVGADGYSKDAQEAIKTAHKLIDKT